MTKYLTNPLGERVKIRGYDIEGGGDYGAPRGVMEDGRKRTHRGLDLVGCVGSLVRPPLPLSIVNRIGMPYGDPDARASSYNHYIALRERDGVNPFGFPFEIRLLYINVASAIKKENLVVEDQVIGWLGDIGERYPGITTHLHFDLRNLDTGEWVDPAPFLYFT